MYLCQDPANIQLQLVNRLSAACYVRQLAAQARPQMFHIHLYIISFISSFWRLWNAICDKNRASMNRLTLALNRLTIALNRSTMTLNRSTMTLNRSTMTLNQLTMTLNRLTVALNRLTMALNRLTMTLNRSVKVLHVGRAKWIEPSQHLSECM